MKNKILFVVSVIFGLMFINAGLNKFFNYMPMPENMPEEMMKIMTAFGSISWLMPLVGATEIIGGILFIPNKYRALGAIVILPVMTGILVHHLVLSPSDLVMPLVLFGINIWVIIENWKKYLPMVR